jgi:alpha-L-fucosidase
LLASLNQTTIGHQRILTFPKQAITGLRIRINDAKADPLLSGISIFRINDDLVEK